jgi:hypothetical protein
MRTLPAWAMCLALAAPAGAEGSRDLGNVIVHFSTMPSTMVTTEVARAHAITRSKNRHLLTVSVLEKRPDGLGQPVPARVAARAINLNGQLRGIPLREVREGGAIYYLGEVRISGEETLDFELEITPPGGETQGIRFRKQLLAD